MALLSINALLAGVTAGLLREFRDGSFQEGFTRGSLGGAVAFGGRRLAVEDFWGAGLLGRQVSAIGASLTRNAGEDQGALSHLYLPVGPFQLRIDPRQRQVRAKIDLFTTASLITAVLDDRLAIDGSASLSAGAPVFRAERHNLQSDGRHVRGLASGGVIILGRSAVDAPHDVFAHERVHVLQQDMGNQLWGYPLENWIAGIVPRADVLLRFVHAGLAYPLMTYGLGDVLDLEWHSRPWEIEAEYLESR